VCAVDVNELDVQKRVPELNRAFGGGGEASGALTRPAHADAPGVTSSLFRQSARLDQGKQLRAWESATVIATSVRPAPPSFARGASACRELELDRK
jgi:hypothetical protein